MTSPLAAALVAAAAAILGGLLTAFATRSVERLRLRASLIEKAEERKLAAIERFLLAVNAWIDWLIYMEERGWQDGDQLELNARVKARDDAWRQLLLLSSDTLHAWLTSEYNALEYEVKRTYARQVRYSGRVDDEARQVRRAFTQLLREDMIQRMRPEVAALRDPVQSGR